MLDSGYLEGPSLGVRPLLPGSRPQTVRAGTQVGLQTCARKAVTTRYDHRYFPVRAAVQPYLWSPLRAKEAELYSLSAASL